MEDFFNDIYRRLRPQPTPFGPGGPGGQPPFGPGGQPPFGPGGQPPFGPGGPGGQPPFGPGGPGGQPPFGPGGPGGAPTSPPPSFVPEQTAFRVDPGSIRQCMFNYTYIWLINGMSFWFYPIYIGRTSIAGYRWIGFRWVYFGTDLRNISSFFCY